MNLLVLFEVLAEGPETFEIVKEFVDHLPVALAVLDLE
jgi:hypothetical protein